MQKMEPPIWNPMCYGKVRWDEVFGWSIAKLAMVLNHPIGWETIKLKLKYLARSNDFLFSF